MLKQESPHKAGWGVATVAFAYNIFKSFATSYSLKLARFLPLLSHCMSKLSKKLNAHSLTG
jgi:hypothetical protein